MAILTKCYLCPESYIEASPNNIPPSKKNKQINELNPTDFKEGQNHNSIIQDRGVRSSSIIY